MTARRTAIASCSPDAASPAVTTVIDIAEGIAPDARRRKVASLTTKLGCLIPGGWVC